MSKKIMDFQAATADRIAEIFREGRQRRVLLADEVGLGKTIMAKAVIDRVREIRKSLNDDMYRVVYVCSNLNIVNQNTRNLGIETVINTAESRLSMQHLILREKEKGLKRKVADGEMPELLIPLTPGTSFNVGNSTGTVAERALMYLFIREDIGDSQRLSRFFKTGQIRKQESWDNQIKLFSERIEKVGGTYFDDTLRTLRSMADYVKISETLSEQVVAEEVDESSVWKCIINLRRVFALVSMRQLDPDLVIMDEFQRFKDLLDTDSDSDMGMLTRQFFGDNPESQPLVLLLSATPYKPYTTLEELNETNCDEQYEDFMYLMNFLFKNHPEANFRKVWDDYSTSLSQLDAGNFTLLLARKNEAEDMVYKTMCRTERKNVNLILPRIEELPVSEGDILSYAHMQKVLDDCRQYCKEHPEKRIRFNSFKVPIEYVKSCPYLLSFMNNYELKKRIEAVYDDGNGGLRALPGNVQRTCLVQKRAIWRYNTIPSNNARLELLIKEAFENHAELLLWVPASHPYYSTQASNVFERNRKFSKILVFSAWEMVPKMIACMLSYKAEQLVMKQAFSDATYENVKGRPRIFKDNVLFTPNKFLADIYDPKAYFGQPIKAIRKDLKQRIRTHIEQNYPNVPIGKVRCSEKLIRQTAAMLDGTAEECPEKISIKVISILTDLAIGSPAACLMRLLQDRKLVEQTAPYFHSLFSRRQSAAIIQVIYNKRDQDIYYEQVLDYCVMGNLQAVLDEFAFMVGGEPKLLADSLCNAFANMANPSIHTSVNFGHNENSKYTIRTHFSMYFGQAKADEDDLRRSASVRQAFNSPFYPFVLATTSVGQEGLDFHWYCRKIVHWNLPSNPQDLEQREGRINRYECLAIRRNVAKFFGEGIFDWKEIFDHCKEVLHGEYPQSNDLIPYWCLPPEWIEQHGNRLEMIERIVPVYPMSLDTARYDDLIAVLSLYRLTMGQPRQEELLKLIGGKLTEEQTRELLFDFSPSSPKRQRPGGSF